jgi:hypothetical protein
MGFRFNTSRNMRFRRAGPFVILLAIGAIASLLPAPGSARMYPTEAYGTT